MSQLNFDVLDKMSSGAPVQGTVLVQGISVKSAKNGKEYIVGTALTETGQMGFKIWGGPVQEFVASKQDLVNGRVAKVAGKVDEWQGTKSLVIEAFELTDIDPAGYRKGGYDLEGTKQSYLELLNNELSEGAKEIFSNLLSPLGNEFFKEFASITIHHDNVPGGLAAHSLKVTILMQQVLKMYPDIAAKCDRDLLILGIALHDVGKAIEYNYGGISQIGRLVSHRTIANELLAIQKERVIELKGEEWYWRLHSIFAQHHGQYEETPRTYEAVIVHIVDSMESQMTDVSQALRDMKPGNQVRLHGFILS